MNVLGVAAVNPTGCDDTNSCAATGSTLAVVP
jgi:hypothetical protein